MSGYCKQGHIICPQHYVQCCIVQFLTLFENWHPLHQDWVLLTTIVVVHIYYNEYVCFFRHIVIIFQFCDLIALFNETILFTKQYTATGIKTKIREIKQSMCHASKWEGFLCHIFFRKPTIFFMIKYFQKIFLYCIMTSCHPPDIIIK